MLKQYARFFSAMQVHFTEMVGRLRLEALDNNSSILDPGPDGHDWSAVSGAAFWQPFQESCTEIDLDSASAQIDRIRDELKSRPDMLRLQFCGLIEELRNRVKDDLQAKLFLYIPKAKAGYWENETLFGEEVFNKVPEATDDIYEAGSCFAANRPGGTVYHCMGIMQAALFKVGKEIGCTIDLETDDWGSAETKIKEVLKRERMAAERQKGDVQAFARWKRKEAAYNELISDLNAVKKAWRHTSMHFRQTFTLEHAGKILEKVKDFAQHAASLLP
jgi:hypothetical protein